MPLRLRTAVWVAPTELVLGILTLVLNLALGEITGIVLGVLITVLGVLSINSVLVVVEPREVQVKNAFRMTIRRHPIAGLADLGTDGKRLVRASDGKKVATLSPLAVRPDDVAVLRAALAQSGVVA